MAREQSLNPSKRSMNKTVKWRRNIGLCDIPMMVLLTYRRQQRSKGTEGFQSLSFGVRPI